LSDTARPPRAVLDTDVIYSRVLHELIGRLASQERLLTLIWSDELLNEAKRTLVERKPVTEQVAKRWVSYLREAFPDQRVEIEQLPADLDINTLTADSGDHHICALAIAGHADLLLTSDQGYHNKALAEYGVRVVAPDAFLDATFQENADAIMDVLQAQAEVWGGGRPIDDLLNAIQRAGAPTFAGNARRTIDM
jgi:predicted nucleic acid-binding protein